MEKRTLINVQNFIVATRDSGYKSTASALAELVDNAIDARATVIEIWFDRVNDLDATAYEIRVHDNGHGMDAAGLSRALQFGGSTRFNDRHQLGRYGMGLPNSSLSQCRRVEILTWRERGVFLQSELDIDDVINNGRTELPAPRTIRRHAHEITSDSGTIVTWKKCDRLSFRYLKSITKHLHAELGRIFRTALQNGVRIRVAGEIVRPFDPLFVHPGENVVGGTAYGEELLYRVNVPDRPAEVSSVSVRFVELPILAWAALSNDEKRKLQITKRAGVSVLRAGREIDYGWFFMGEKRKENYDDWWRCEIRFQPELDEVFGVTHTKQEIKESEYMRSILTPDCERIARELNNRVRQQFVKLKEHSPKLHAKSQLERTDLYLDDVGRHKRGRKSERTTTRGAEYKIVAAPIASGTFFELTTTARTSTLTVNTEHVFYERVFRDLHNGKFYTSGDFLKILEAIMFAAAGAENSHLSAKERDTIRRFKLKWSSILGTYLS